MRTFGAGKFDSGRTIQARDAERMKSKLCAFN